MLMLKIVVVFWFVSAVSMAQIEPAIEGSPDAAATQPVQDRVADARAPVLGNRPIASLLPAVRLTPRSTSVAGLDSHRLDLNGTWQFAHTLAADFETTLQLGNSLVDVKVPGHYALQGQPRMHTEMGTPVGYRKTFDVPADWSGRRIRLRFEGVDGLIKLWVNNRPIGTNDIACLPSEFDITDHVQYGRLNTLVMTVEKSLVTYWSRRELGGITRHVSLIALPNVNLARLHVDTRIHSNTATANVHLRIANDSTEIAAGRQLRLEIRDGEGNLVPTDLPGRAIRIPPLAAGQMLEMTVPVVVRDPRRWTAETPHLYSLHAALLNDDTELMSASQRFGFRELRVDGHKLLLNGMPIRLRGANYHITYPGLGESVPRELIRKDIELMRGANLNALRSRPTPDVAYVELCDELGMYTTVEAMISLMQYDRGPLGDHGASMDIEAPFLLHVATMIESLYSHPSIIAWGLGNECNYYEYFRTGALGARVADPTRPLFFGSDMRVGVDAPFMDINDDHYPRDGTAHLGDLGRIDGEGWVYPETRPNIFTEWLHVHTNNVKEIAYDPGIDDFWGYAAVAHIEHMYRTPHFLGGFMFKAVPYRGVGVPALWRGLFDEHRRINDLYWHNRKSHSPVRADELNPRWNVDAQTVELPITNRFDFLNLAEIRFEWTQADRSGRVSTDVAPQQTGTLTVPWNRTIDPIVIRAIAPDGREVDRYRLLPPTTTPSAEPPTPGAWSIDENEETVRVTIGAVVYTINRTTGLLSSATSRGNPVLTGPPTLAIVPSQMTRFRGQQKLSLVNQIVDWQAERVEIDRQDDTLTITATGRYSRAAGRFVTTLTRDGHVQIDYDFEWTADTDFNILNTGIALPLDAAMDTLSWDRRALWSDYPDTHIGRATGEARATGDPAFAQARTEQHQGARPWPWSQDMIDGVTRDFRATRFNIHHASLHANDGRRFTVISDGRQHAQATPIHGDLEGDIFTAETHGPRLPGYFLTISNFHNGGTEPHLTKSMVFEQRRATPGERFHDRVRFTITGKPQ